MAIPGNISIPGAVHGILHQLNDHPSTESFIQVNLNISAIKARLKYFNADKFKLELTLV